jgi:Putative DNA-binding domain
MENLQIELLSQLLGNFEFRGLFNELGWSNPASDRAVEFSVAGEKFVRRQISQLSGAVVFEIAAADGAIPEKNLRQKIQLEITKLHQENVLVFVDESRTNSLWYWTKTEDKKRFAREHLYIKGQPVDLMLGKITAMNFDIGEFDADGNVPIVAVANKLQKALDIEKVTKKFFGEFEKLHVKFLDYIEGIAGERDKKWYASVILNRLMFIYFLQKKFFINNDGDYLQKQLAASKAKGADLYYKDFLDRLFFVGFAKPEYERSTEEKNLLGDVPFLNGGLFLPHKIELDENNNIRIADEAFENLFALFESYSWHLDDTPSGKPDEINPDVLGYIFEKYINQKAFGAYYTRPEITNYLCEQTIYKLILDKVNSLAKPADGLTPNMFSSNDGGLFLQRTYDSISDLLLNLDDFLCDKLWHHILPSLKLLDPACGSGAFLVAALKTLLNVYSAVIGKMELLGGSLKDELDRIRKDHAFNYFLKKRIITDNLFGVDIMEEATEIAKLRLFMALVSSIKDRKQLEPLPNIDFNILAGNSLIGILKVDEKAFEKIGATGEAQPSMFADIVSNDYRKVLADKEESIRKYKEESFNDEVIGGVLDKSERLLRLREHIYKLRKNSYEKLNELLLGDFNDLKIKFEESIWNTEKNKPDKPKKRDLTKKDIEDLQPFHWGFEFPEVFKHGGFDAIITNPPWEVFQTDEKEFFEEILPKDEREKIHKKKIRIEDWKNQLAELMKDECLRNNWLEYANQFPHVSKYFKTIPQFKNQISVIDDKNVGSKVNLYNLFVEQCFNLLRQDGECGIVIPSGIYTDLGATQLRKMLFDETEITGLFGFENRKEIFEGVHRSFKFVVLTFRVGGETKSFPTAFMRHEVSELVDFPRKGALKMNVELIKRLSPDSLSLMEFKSNLDIEIAERMLGFPLLAEKIEDRWNLELTSEFNMTTASRLFGNSSGEDRLPLYEGKMIHQFIHNFSEPRYWINEVEGRKAVLGRKKDTKQNLDYQTYRLGFRDIARNTDSRTLISTIIPPAFHGNKLPTVKIYDENSDMILSHSEQIFLSGIFNSFVLDYFLRLKVTASINFFYVYTLPVPRLTENDAAFAPIVERAAKLICTAPEFDDLAQEVGLGSYTNGVTEAAERQTLRAELDALVAHLYGLTETEFAYILTTFPIVAETVKTETLDAFRTFAPHPDDAQILAQIPKGENNYLEFKVAACRNAATGAKDDSMRENITQTVAAFANSRDGGALLIGVENDGTIAGLAEDFKTANPQKQDRDGYERFLVDVIRKNCHLTDVNSICEITFHNLVGKEICRISVKPSPQPVYHGNHNDFIIRDGGGKRKLNPKEAVEYIEKHWKQS